MNEPLKLEILEWSHTDYAFLINNNLGYVSDDFLYYVFDNVENMTSMKKYFELQAEQIIKGAEILSDKGYEVSTLEDYEEFVRKRNER